MKLQSSDGARPLRSVRFANCVAAFASGGAAARLCAMAAMNRGLLIELAYKASHFVSRLEHPVHSSPHFHTWDVILRVRGEADAHEIQEWMHHTAPHFGDHGDKGV